MSPRSSTTRTFSTERSGASSAMREMLEGGYHSSLLPLARILGSEDDLVGRLLDILFGDRKLPKPGLPQHDLLDMTEGVRWMLHEGIPGSLGILDKIKRRILPFMASGLSTDPLSFAKANVAIAPAMIRLLSSLVEPSPPFHLPVDIPSRDSIAALAYLCWLVFIGQCQNVEDFRTTTFSCIRVTNHFSPERESFLANFVAKNLGGLPAAEYLTGAILHPMNDIETLGDVLNLSGTMIGFLGCSEYFMGLGLHSRVVELYWSFLCISPAREDILFKTSFFVIRFCMRLFEEQLSQQLESATSLAHRAGRMITNVHLIDIGTQALFAYGRFPEIYHAGAIPDYMIHYYQQLVLKAVDVRPDIVESYILPRLLFSMDRFRELDVCENSAIIVEACTEIISHCGVTEKMLRQREAHVRGGLGVPAGCSWYQCVLHGGEAEGALPRTMLWDGRCGQVQYCNTLCQKRDWSEGRHRLYCSPHTS